MSNAKQSSSSKKIRDIDEETSALVKNYRIPRREKELKDIIREVQFDSREYQHDICPLLKQNYYQRSESEKNFQYVHCYAVQNVEAASQFEARKRELKSTCGYAEKDLVTTHGFLEVRSVDEAKILCKEGLQCGNREFGCIGKPNMGVYLSRYSDVLTPAPLVPGTSGTLIIYKIIKGRIKSVPFESFHLEPTPGFDCHICKISNAELQNASCLRTFEALQMYLYEYDDTEIASFVRHISAVAVVTYDYGSPLSRPKEHAVWTGALVCGYRLSLQRVQLMAAHGKMQPYSLGKSLDIKKLTNYECVLNWPPIKEILADSMQPTFHRRREVQLSNGICACTYRLINERSEDFKSFVNKLAKHRAVALASMCSGNILIIFPTGELSDLIGLPRYSDSANALNCLVMGYRSCIAGMNFVKDPYDFNTTQTALSGSRINLAKLRDISTEEDMDLSDTNSDTQNTVSTPSGSVEMPPPQAFGPSASIPVADEDLRLLASVATTDRMPDEKLARNNPPKLIPSGNALALLLDPRVYRTFEQKLNDSCSSSPRLTADERIFNLSSSPSARNGNGNNLNAGSLRPTIGTTSKDVDLRTIIRQQMLNLDLLARRPEPSLTGQSIDDHFVSVDDTPSSPGPQDTGESLNEFTLKPVNVPLESARPSLLSSPAGQPAQRSRINWSAITKTLSEQAANRSDDLLLSQKERAIVSGKILLDKMTLASAFDAIIEPSEDDEKRPDLSAVLQPPQPTVPLSEPDERDMPTDRLVIEEEERRRTPVPVAADPSISSESAIHTEPLATENLPLAHNATEDEAASWLTSTAGCSEENIQGAGLHGKGLLIPDDLVFVTTPAQDADFILTEFDTQFRAGKADWSMKVHSQMVLKLAGIKKNLDAKSEAYERVTRLLILLTRFRNIGRVELLARHDCDVASRASRDYLGCLMKIKRENPGRNCIFLSNLNPTSDVAKEFIASGIKVMNVSVFKDTYLKYDK